MGQTGWTRYIQRLFPGPGVNFWVPEYSVSQKQIDSLTTSP